MHGISLPSKLLQHLPSEWIQRYDGKLQSLQLWRKQNVPRCMSQRTGPFPLILYIYIYLLSVIIVDFFGVTIFNMRVLHEYQYRVHCVAKVYDFSSRSFTIFFLVYMFGHTQKTDHHLMLKIDTYQSFLTHFCT